MKLCAPATRVTGARLDCGCTYEKRKRRGRMVIDELVCEEHAREVYWAGMDDFQRGDFVRGVVRAAERQLQRRPTPEPKP